MQKRLLKFCGFAWKILFLVLIINSLSFGKTFLWEVKSDSSTVYLLGSIHIAKESLYPLPKVIDSCFSLSQNLVVEANMFNINPLKIFKMSFYSDTNESLEKNIDAESFKKLEAFFRKHNVEKSAYNKYKPWFAISNIINIISLRNGFKAELGIDYHFMNEAKKDKKNILELEGAEFQVELLDKGLKKFSSDFIDYSLLDTTDFNAGLDSLFLLWKNGMTDEFEQLAFKDFETKKEYEEINKLMITDRNEGMFKKLEEFMKEGGTYFVVVGAGHLTGEKGLVNLFSKKYKIRQL